MGVRAIDNLYEAGHRLDLTKPEVMMAAIAYHRVQEELGICDSYYQELLAAGALCAVFTLYQKPIDLKDVVNVYYEIIYLNKAVSNENSAGYQSLLEHIPTTAKCVCWVLQHSRLQKLPVMYLSFYLRSVCHATRARDHPKIKHFISAAWSLMMSCHKARTCVKYAAEHLALAVIFICMLVYDISISSVCTDTKWMQALCPDMTEEILYEVISSMRREVFSRK